MNITTSNIMIKTLKSEHDSGVISFKALMQRRAGQWGNYDASLFIDSILNNYPIPDIFVWENNGIKYVIDGVQRLSNTFDYLNDLYKINRAINPIKSGDDLFDICDKKFSELPLELKTDLERSKFRINIISDCSYEQAADIFYRLNNSATLSKNQKGKARYSKELIEVVNEILNSDFYSKHVHLSKAQYRKEDDLTTLLQTMIMFAQYYSEYEIKNLSSSECNKFVEKEDVLSKEWLSYLRESINYLDMALVDTDIKIRKINVPMVVLTAYQAVIDDVDSEIFADWLYFFVNDTDLQEIYKEYCGQGSTSKEKALGRAIIMKDSLEDYIKKQDTKVEDVTTEVFPEESVEEITTELNSEDTAVDDIGEELINE